jgi:hypothetical protein
MDKSRPGARQLHLLDLPMLPSPIEYLYRSLLAGRSVKTLQLSTNLLQVSAELTSAGGPTSEPYLSRQPCQWREHRDDL